MPEFRGFFDMREDFFDWASIPFTRNLAKSHVFLDYILSFYWCWNLYQVKESFGDEDSSTWRIHWDHQLYKVLELHYASGLSSLVDRLPDIQLDLVIRGDQISFRPELENARARFYKEVKRFSQIPYSFRGVSDEKDFFIEIGYSNRIVWNNASASTHFHQPCLHLISYDLKSLTITNNWTRWRYFWTAGEFQKRVQRMGTTCSGRFSNWICSVAPSLLDTSLWRVSYDFHTTQFENSMKGGFE